MTCGPLWLTPDSLRATDIAAGMDKTFLLAKVEIAGAETRLTTPGQETRTVGEAVAPHVEELRALGWHVELSRDAAGLHGYFKNGKLRKTATVALAFYEEADAFDDDVDVTVRLEMPSMELLADATAGTLTIERGVPRIHQHEERRSPRPRSPRPYSVSGQSAPSRSYGSLRKATAIFLEQGRQHAPRRTRP